MSKFQKFIFVISSLIPGAGHMCLGFMKRGLLLMTVYFVDVGLSMIMNGFLVFMPVIWFYCLFDAWNKFYLTDEERKHVDDSLIFFYNAIPEELLPKSKRFSKKIPQKFYRAAGIAVVFFGIVMLCNEIRENITLPKIAFEILSFLPELMISCALIILGIKLIIHKKNEIYSDKSNDSSNHSGTAEPNPNMLNAVFTNSACETQPAVQNIPSPAPEPMQPMQEENETQEISGPLPSAPSNETVSQSESAREIDEISSSILDDINSSLTPMAEGTEVQNADEIDRYIWSSPAKSNDNPQ